MAITLTKGTKEYVTVTVVDSLESLSSLTSPVYDVIYDDDTFLYTAAAGVASGLQVNCMFDISATGPDGLLDEDTRLRLFLSFTNGPEIVRLGPVIVKIIDEGI